MKRILTALFAVAFATAAFADGAATFKAKCAVCHGAGGEGAKMYSKPIKGMAEADVLKVIDEGKGKMKPVKIDNAAEVAKFVAGLK